MSNCFAHAKAASCSAARLAASHVFFDSVSASLAAFQQSVQLRPCSQRANPARRSAGRLDRSCSISCPQLWTTVQVFWTATWLFQLSVFWVVSACPADGVCGRRGDGGGSAGG